MYSKEEGKSAIRVGRARIHEGRVIRYSDVPASWGLRLSTFIRGVKFRHGPFETENAEFCMQEYIEVAHWPLKREAESPSKHAYPCFETAARDFRHDIRRRGNGSRWLLARHHTVCSGPRRAASQMRLAVRIFSPRWCRPAVVRGALVSI